MAKIYPVGFGKIVWRIPGPGKASDAIVSSDFELLSGPSTGTPTPDQIVAGVAIRANVMGLQLLQTRLGVGWSYAGVRVTYRSLAAELGAEVTPTPVVLGTVVSPAPPQVAMVVRKTSNLVGRKYKGRMYMPGILTDATIDDAGLITAGAVTSWQALFNTFLTAASLPAGTTESSFALAIVHSAPKTGGATPAPNRVQALSVQSLTATQRRRIR